MKLFDFKRILRYFSRNDWRIIISAFAVILIGLLIVNSYIFWRIKREMIKPLVVGTEIQALKRDLFNKVLVRIEKKEQLFNEGIVTKPDIKDPSL